MFHLTRLPTEEADCMTQLILGLAVATSMWNGQPVEMVVCHRPIDPRCMRHIRKARRERRALRAFVNHRRKYTAPYRSWLASTRSCESGGNYRTATGNGFYGAYQFVDSTWWGVGGRGYPHQNPPLEQDYRATILLQRSGSNPWPVCG